MRDVSRRYMMLWVWVRRDVVGDTWWSGSGEKLHINDFDWWSGSGKCSLLKRAWLDKGIHCDVPQRSKSKRERVKNIPMTKALLHLISYLGYGLGDLWMSFTDISLANCTAHNMHHYIMTPVFPCCHIWKPVFCRRGYLHLAGQVWNHSLAVADLPNTGEMNTVPLRSIWTICFAATWSTGSGSIQLLCVWKIHGRGP